MKTIQIILSFLLLMNFMTPVYAQDKILATAGDSKITEQEINQMIIDQIPPATKYKIQKQVIDAIIQQKYLGKKVIYYIQEPIYHIDIKNHPYQGNPEAKILVIEFLDFQCPYCKAAVETVDTIFQKYPDKVKLVTINFPLPFHNSALPAANAAMCAQDQNKYWSLYHTMFKDQSKLDPDSLKQTAKTLGLDTKQFNECVDHQKYYDSINRDVQIGKNNHIEGTPTFIVDGKMTESYKDALEQVSKEIMIKYGN